MERKDNFSLAALFLLIASLAVMFAVTRSAVVKWENREHGIAWVIAGSLLGAISGCAIGINTTRWFRGAFSGFILGAVSGAMVGAQLAGPPNPTVLLVGIAMLLGYGFLIRRKSPANHWPESQATLIHPLDRPDAEPEKTLSPPRADSKVTPTTPAPD